MATLENPYYDTEREAKMNDEINSTDIVARQNYDVQLRDFENGLLNFLDQHNLPSQSIFVDVHERVIVFQNLGNVLLGISHDKKQIAAFYRG